MLRTYDSLSFVIISQLLALFTIQFSMIDQTHRDRSTLN